MEEQVPLGLVVYLTAIGWAVGWYIMYRAFKKWKERIMNRERMYPKFYVPYDKEEEAIQEMCRFLDSRKFCVEDLIPEHHKAFLEEHTTYEVTSAYPPYPPHLHALFRLCAVLKLKIIII